MRQSSRFLVVLASLIINWSGPLRAAGDVTSPPFQIGDRVQTVGATPLWPRRRWQEAWPRIEPAFAPGAISDGPVRASDVWWWKVRFDNGPEGWVAERQLRGPGGQPAGPRLGGTRPPPRPPTGGALSFVSLGLPNGATVGSAGLVLRGKVTNDSYALPLVSFSINGSDVGLDRDGNFSLPVTLRPGANTFALRISTPNPRQQKT